MAYRVFAMLGLPMLLVGCGPEMNVQQGPDSGLARYDDGLMPDAGTTVAMRGGMGPVYMTEALKEAGTTSDETGMVERLNTTIGGVTPNPALAVAASPTSPTAQSANVPIPPDLPRQSTPQVENGAAEPLTRRAVGP